jgi:hypothetical protein
VRHTARNSRTASQMAGGVCVCVCVCVCASPPRHRALQGTSLQVIKEATLVSVVVVVAHRLASHQQLQLPCTFAELALQHTQTCCQITSAGIRMEGGQVRLGVK